MEEPVVAGVLAPHPGRGGADRLGLSVRNEHAAGPARFGGGLCQGGRQGHRQPDVAEGERRLGRLERPVVGGGADRPSDPRRDSGPRQARQEGDLDFPSCRARRQDIRSEGAIGREKHGRRKRGGLAGAARRSRQAGPEDPGPGDRGRRIRPRRRPGGALVRRPCPALHGTNAIERLHEEFKRRIKTQTVLPAAETAAMLFWALMASGQITMRKVDGWKTLAEQPSDQVIDLAA